MTLTTCPGASAPSSDAEDILDEALFYFRANVLFRNFEVRRQGMGLALANATAHVEPHFLMPDTMSAAWH